MLHYGVDHSPSYLWRTATSEISEALLPFLPAVLNGPDAWRAKSKRSGMMPNWFNRTMVTGSPRFGPGFEHPRTTFAGKVCWR